jgi:hypothetical protein
MSLPSAIFPNETYTDGLRTADASVVESLYNEFRLSVVKAIEGAAGNYADGAVFFRVALIQTATLIHEDQYPKEIPVEEFIHCLAVRQFQDWREEKNQEPVSMPALSEEERVIWGKLPEIHELRFFRGMIKAKREFYRLETEDQRQVLTIVNHLALGEQADHPETENPSLQRYKKTLGSAESDASGSLLAPHIVKALTDQHFHLVWSACDAIEQRLKSAQVPNHGENKTIRYAFLTLLVLTIGYGLATWLFRDRSPAEVYNQNFQPPKGILSDMEQRYAKDTAVLEKPEACAIAFAEADAFYQKKEWRSAASVLAGMMEDEYKPCQSDALFYLAIVGLQLEQPELTLECISKIEDLERFGEDIYWYMALAYVKKAAIDPSEKEMAQRALERALSNTEIPERRIQAEKMLEELAEK